MLGTIFSPVVFERAGNIVGHSTTDTTSGDSIGSAAWSAQPRRTRKIMMQRKIVIACDSKLSDSGPGARMGARRREAKARAVLGFMAGSTARD